MNFLYLHAHDLGRWIAPYGSEADTPNLSRLAEESGTRLFRNAHCAAPTCSPSRAALLTGMPPHEAGMMGLMHRGFRLHDPEKTLPAHLQQNGYETVLSGIQHLQPGNSLTGYDCQFKGVKSDVQYGRVDWKEYDLSVAEQAAGFLAEPGKTRPFFLDCGFWLPHRPFPDPDGDIESNSAVPPPGVADTPETRLDMAGFLAAVRHMDRCCGIVLDAVAESPHAEDTIVIFTTDHGPAFPGWKCNLTAKGTGVALMLKIPGLAGNEETDRLVSQLDLFPTICEYLDLDPPDWPLRGQSLGPLIRGEVAVEEAPPPAFSEVTYHAGYEPMRAIRTETHSLVQIFHNDLSPVPANVDDSAAKDALIESGWLEQPRDAVQLYDLRNDPDETRNVADDPEYAEVRRTLEQRLRNWMAETDDPLFLGPVSLPPGGYANDRSHLSPTIGE